MSNERFWLENPSILLSDLTFLPSENDTIEQKLNSITRLILIIAIILAFMKWKHWLTFLVVAMVLIIFIYLLKCKRNKKSIIENFNENMSNFQFYSSSKNMSEDDGKTYFKNQEELYTYIVMPAASDDNTDTSYFLEKNKILPTKRKEKTANELMMEFNKNEDPDDPVERDRKALFDTSL